MSDASDIGRTPWGKFAAPMAHYVDAYCRGPNSLPTLRSDAATDLGRVEPTCGGFSAHNHAGRGDSLIGWWPRESDARQGLEHFYEETVKKLSKAMSPAEWSSLAWDLEQASHRPRP